MNIDVYFLLILFIFSKIPQTIAVIKSLKYIIHKPIKYSYEFYDDSFQVTTCSNKEIDETGTLLYSNIKTIKENDLFLIIIGSDSKKYIIDKLSLDKDEYITILTNIKSLLN